MRKYAIKKPSNLKTILSIDEWTRNKAIKIINNTEWDNIMADMATKISAIFSVTIP